MTSLAILLLLALQDAEPRSRIYVYAQRDTPANRWQPVSCDGSVAAEIRHGAFFAIDVDPGRHTLVLEHGVPLSIEVGPGIEAFVRLDWRHRVGQQPIPLLAVAPREIAAREMRFLSYVEPKRLKSSAVPRSDPRTPEQPRLRTRPDHR